MQYIFLALLLLTSLNSDEIAIANSVNGNVIAKSAELAYP